MNQKLLMLLLLLTVVPICNTAIAQSGKEVAIQQLAENKNWMGSGITNFDLSIIHFLQKFSRKNLAADEFVVFVSGTKLIKGGILMSALWWFWFLPGTQDSRKRKMLIILTLLAGLIALTVGRILVALFPFRQRPINSPELHLTIPYGTNFDGIAKLSSFPSDHAVLFFAISTGIYFLSKKIGLLAYLYSFLFILFPRVYLCYHYPSDIIVGAFVGIAICYFTCTNSWMQYIAKKIYSFSEQKPQIFYAAFFLLSYEIIQLFEDLRDLITFAHHYII